MKDYLEGKGKIMIPILLSYGSNRFLSLKNLIKNLVDLYLIDSYFLLKNDRDLTNKNEPELGEHKSRIRQKLLDQNTYEILLFLKWIDVDSDSIP